MAISLVQWPDLTSAVTPAEEHPLGPRTDSMTCSWQFEEPRGSVPISFCAGGVLAWLEHLGRFTGTKGWGCSPAAPA